MKLNFVPAVPASTHQLRDTTPREAARAKHGSGESAPVLRGGPGLVSTEDSAEYSDTEHPFGAHDEAMSARRLQSALTRQLSRIAIAPTEPQPVGRQGARSSLSTQPKLDRSSIEAQVVDVSGTSPTAARALGQKRGAQERPSEPPSEPDSPTSPGRKLRKLFSRRSEDSRDTMMGSSAPW